MPTAPCQKCGQEIGAGARWCPNCGTPRGRTVRCHSCGNQFPSNLGECHRCGAVGAAAYGRKHTDSVIVGVLVIVLIFVGILGLFAWNQHSKNTNQQQQRRNQEQEQQQWRKQKEQQQWRNQQGFDR